MFHLLALCVLIRFTVDGVAQKLQRKSNKKYANRKGKKSTSFNIEFHFVAIRAFLISSGAITRTICFVAVALGTGHYLLGGGGPLN